MQLERQRGGLEKQCEKHTEKGTHAGNETQDRSVKKNREPEASTEEEDKRDGCDQTKSRIAVDNKLFSVEVF